jgi:transcriptional regulator with XRE-family HTH domain
LRRAELARLAGVSVNYVIQLEQGRARHPSPQTVQALARALRLRPTERDHLFRCAELVPPADREVPRELSPGARRLVDAMTDLPVAVFTADWEVLAWSELFALVLGDPRGYGWPNNSMVESVFAAAGSWTAEEVAGWRDGPADGTGSIAELMVADLRSIALKYPADDRLNTMITRLVANNAYFAHLRTRGAAGLHMGGQISVKDSAAGDLTLECHVLMVSDGDLRIVVFGAADVDAADRLGALRARAPTALHQFDDS